MRIQKALKLALNILVHSKLRSWLTIIGIVLGVAAVVAIVSMGNGLQANVQSRLSSFGADQITLSPGGSRAQGGFRGFGQEVTSTTVKGAKNLTTRDVAVLRTVENVSVVSGTISGRVDVYYTGEKTQLSVQGVDPLSWNQITTATLAIGRFLTPADKYMAVVGNGVATTVFKNKIGANQVITIGSKSFKVVGVLEPSAGFGGSNNQIIIPIDAAREVLTDVGSDNLNSITIKVSDANAIQATQDAIDHRLMIARQVNVRNKDYSLTNSQATQQQLSSVTSTITLFLAAIAAVSLLVGGVGIANTMFTSVLERTKEIGIMKAIGAQDRDILLIFLFNAAMVGAVGGIIGILLGVMISFWLPSLGIRFGGGPGGGAITTVISPSLLIFALAIAVGVAVIAGIVPAYRASKLRPVEALRYE